MAAKLVRIKQVALYVALSEHAQLCYEMKKAVDDMGLPYVLMAYNDDSAHKGLLAALSSWSWGPKGEKHVFTGFPLLTWLCCYEDFETHPACALSIAEVRAKLLPLRDLIKL